MKAILFVMAMALASWSVPAHAEPLPKEFIGLWCYEGETNGLALYSDGKEKCINGLNFKRNGYDGYYDNALNIKCTYLSIKHTDAVIIRIVARCFDKGEHEDGSRFTAKLNLSLNRIRELTIRWE
jgi:hypothetical protein